MIRKASVGARALLAMVVATASATAESVRSRGSAPASDTLTQEVLATGGRALTSVLAAPEKHRFQVLYGIVGTSNGKPTLERHGYRTDAEYFFPASSMKMPLALATYDRFAVLRRGDAPSLTRDATLRIHPTRGNGEPYVTTLAFETKRALIVSDNAAANRLLGLVGHREVHEILWGVGLASVRLHTGFATGAEIDPATISPAVDVVMDGKTVPVLAARKSDLVLPPTDATGLDIGEATIEDGRRIPKPMSFAEKNAIKLRELQDTLVRIMRPELLPSIANDKNAKGARNAKSVTASPEDFENLRTILGTLPSDSGIAGYARNVVADYRLLPFLRGIERVLPRGSFRIHSKVGQAYGFLVHNAYVVENETGRAFFLVASIYANPDATMNNDNYPYEAVSFPALADVGEAFARHAFGRVGNQSPPAVSADP